MKLKELELVNFRNYGKLELEFSKNIICFTGLNGQGKTNVVEAVAVLGLLNSFRTQNYSDFIKFGEEYFFIKGVFSDKNQRSLEIQISYDNKTKKIVFQNKRILRFSEMWGKIPVVYLIPDESVITNGPPSARREFTDKLLSMVDSEYFSALNDYNTVIKQKNRMLLSAKQGGRVDMNILKVYNSKIASLSTEIYSKRLDFLKDFLVYFKEIFPFISNNLYDGDIKYETDYDRDRYFESLNEKLDRYAQVEIKRGTSLLGAHKDDLEFLLNERQLKKFGSKGQHKLFLVALKLAEIEYIKSITDEYPVFILDDLYSEIDEKKSLSVARILDKDIQTFITTSNSRIVDQLDKKITQLFMIDNAVCRAV